MNIGQIAMRIATQALLTTGISNTTSPRDGTAPCWSRCPRMHALKIMWTVVVPAVNVAPKITYVTSKTSGGGTATKAAKWGQVRMTTNIQTERQTHGAAKSMTWERHALLLKLRVPKTSIHAAKQLFAKTP